MSKLTNREYRNIAKRPEKSRGFGFATRRPVLETPVEEMLREAEEDLTELGEQEAEIVEPVSQGYDKVFEKPQQLGSIDGVKAAPKKAAKK